MYQALTDNSILRLADSATIPTDPDNRDYAEALEWLATNDLLPADPEPDVVVTQVTMRQAQLALLAMDKLDAVDAIMATQPRAARIAWSTAAVVDRADPLVQQLADALNLDLDDLFELAVTL